MSDLVTYRTGRAVFRVKTETMHQLLALKPRKRRLAVERRKYPRFIAGVTSTQAYVAEYFRLNSQDSKARRWDDLINAYDNPKYVDHLALYQPLRTEPAAYLVGDEVVEEAAA